MAHDPDDQLGRRRERRRLRALVADDDAALRRLLAAVLELDGWEVQCASDGEEALALAAEYEPDAVLLDVMMPRADGITALRRLRESAAGKDCGVMMVTALGEEGAQQSAVDAGCDDYVVKPFEIEDITARVLKLVKAQTPQEA
jgi:two-component system OmpR family response regulator